MANGIKLGNNTVSFKVGNTDVDAIYLGNTLVYSGGTPPSPTSITYTVTLTGLENGDTINYIDWNNGDSYEFNPSNGTYTYTTTATSIDVNIMYDSSSYSANADYAMLDENDTSYTFVLTPTGGGGGLESIPYGTDMSQYYGRNISRFVINDTTYNDEFTQIAFDNYSSSLNVSSWGVSGMGVFSNVNSLPIDVTLSTPIQLFNWSYNNSSTINPFQDLEIEFI